MCSNICGNLQQIDGDFFFAYLYLRGLIRYLYKLIGISPLDLTESSLGLNVKDVFLTGSQESEVGKCLQHFLLNRLN